LGVIKLLARVEFDLIIKHGNLFHLNRVLGRSVGVHNFPTENIKMEVSAQII